MENVEFRRRTEIACAPGVVDEVKRGQRREDSVLEWSTGVPRS